MEKRYLALIRSGALGSKQSPLSKFNSCQRSSENIGTPFIKSLNKIIWLIIIFASLILLISAKKVFAPNLAHAQSQLKVSVAPSVSPTASSTFDKVAWCESNDVATAKNTTSTASGRFQFLDGTWRYYGEQLWGKNWVKHSKLDFNDSTILAAYAYGKNGLADWSESSKCWSK